MSGRPKRSKQEKSILKIQTYIPRTITEIGDPIQKLDDYSIKFNINGKTWSLVDNNFSIFISKNVDQENNLIDPVKLKISSTDIEKFVISYFKAHNLDGKGRQDFLTAVNAYIKEKTIPKYEQKLEEKAQKILKKVEKEEEKEVIAKEGKEGKEKEKEKEEKIVENVVNYLIGEIPEKDLEKEKERVKQTMEEFEKSYVGPSLEQEEGEEYTKEEQEKIFKEFEKEEEKPPLTVIKDFITKLTKYIDSQGETIQIFDNKGRLLATFKLSEDDKAEEYIRNFQKLNKGTSEFVKTFVKPNLNNPESPVSILALYLQLQENGTLSELERIEVERTIEELMKKGFTSEDQKKVANMLIQKSMTKKQPKPIKIKYQDLKRLKKLKKIAKKNKKKMNLKSDNTDIIINQLF